MKTKDAFLSTRDPAPSAMPHLDQILPTMRRKSAWNLGKPIVHVIDREADSVGHYRKWDAGGHKVLIRADDRKVLWRGRSCETLGDSAGTASHKVRIEMWDRLCITVARHACKWPRRP